MMRVAIGIVYTRDPIAVRRIIQTDDPASLIECHWLLHGEAVLIVERDQIELSRALQDPEYLHSFVRDREPAERTAESDDDSLYPLWSVGGSV